MGRDRLLIGFALVAFGYAVLGNYVALPGYIRFLERGGTSAAGNALDVGVVLGAARTILWMYAFCLGAMSLYLHSLLARHRRYVGWGLGICVGWLAFWSIPALPRMPPAFFLIVGTAILGLIVLTNLSRSPVREDRAGFLLSTAVLFFALATWDVCGLGSTGRILHPDEVVLDRSQTLLSTQTTKLMIALLIAWACLAMARLRRADQRSDGEGVA